MDKEKILLAVQMSQLTQKEIASLLQTHQPTISKALKGGDSKALARIARLMLSDPYQQSHGFTQDDLFPAANQGVQDDDLKLEVLRLRAEVAELSNLLRKALGKE